jgi:lactoylglutathione lyase
VRRVDYVIRFVRDLDASVAFYRDVLGIPVKLIGDGYVEFETENVKFGLYDRSRLEELIGAVSREGSGPEGEVVFVVDNVDPWVERLRGAGAEIRSGPVDRPWGHRTVHVADPDGFIVELAQEIPRPRPD